MALPPTIIKLFIKLPVLFLIEIEKKSSITCENTKEPG